ATRAVRGRSARPVEARASCGRAQVPARARPAPRKVRRSLVNPAFKICFPRPPAGEPCSGVAPQHPHGACYVIGQWIVGKVVPDRANPVTKTPAGSGLSMLAIGCAYGQQILVKRDSPDPLESSPEPPGSPCRWHAPAADSDHGVEGGPAGKALFAACTMTSPPPSRT